MGRRKKYVIRHGDNVFEASKYQCDIFHNVEHGVGNMIINAAAGASKSSTAINCIDIISPDKKVLFIAFNKEIVENIRTRVKRKENALISTFHSLGFSIIKENLRGKKIGDDFVFDFKYKNYIKSNIAKLTEFKEIDSLKKQKNAYIKNIIALVEYARYYLAFTEKEIQNISDKYGLVLYRDEVKVVRKVLKWGKSHLDQIDYTDMIWLPNVLNMTTKKYLFDWVLIDEAQDTSIAEQQLVDKCFKRGARFIAVLDKFQQINIWCGSTEEAIDNFKKYPNTNEYILPITYRCPKTVVELAKRYSDNIIAADNAIDGEIRYNVSKNQPTGNDMVLCRNTAPLVDLHLHYMRINKKSYIKGFENIKESYLSLIDSSDATIIDNRCVTTKGLIPKLYIKLLEQIDKIKATYKIDDEDAIMQQSVYGLYDSIEGIKVLSEGLSTVDELKDKINIVFSGSEKDAIQLSTVHKAKGLEADNVYILCPSLMPSKNARKPWEQKSEQNLIYVAYTRAKKTLNFIEEEKRFNGSTYGNLLDPDNIKALVDMMRKKLKYNSHAEVTEKLEKPKKLGCKVEEEKPVLKVGKKKNAASKFAKILK